MRVLILGLPKSATTAVFNDVASSLRRPAIYFEPTYFGLAHISEDVRFHHQATRRKLKNVVTKCLIFPRANRGEPDKLREVAACYDKVIVMRRDPRDRLISESFYMWYKEHRLWNRRELAEYLELLRAKERSPEQVPFCRLCRPLPGEVGDDYLVAREADTYVNLFSLHDILKEFLSFRYEDYVDCNLSALESYLQIRIKRTKLATDGELMRRVARTKRYGNWRDWFTDQDVALFAPIYKDYLTAFYPNYDWQLNHPTHLDPAVGSLYVERIAARDS